MRHARRMLEWNDQGGVWLARASRSVGGRYQITMRAAFEDGRVFDVHRLVRSGPDVWRPSYLGSGTSLERAQAPSLDQRPADRARSR